MKEKFIYYILSTDVVTIQFQSILILSIVELNIFSTHQPTRIMKQFESLWHVNQPI